MEQDSRGYLVILYDEATNATLTQTVKAVTGFDAGVHALHFDSEEETREGGGYRILAVFSSVDLRKYADELDGLSGPVAPRYDDSDIEFDSSVIISGRL